MIDICRLVVNKGCCNILKGVDQGVMCVFSNKYVSDGTLYGMALYVIFRLRAVGNIGSPVLLALLLLLYHRK